jgi:hypothetical protein
MPITATKYLFTVFNINAYASDHMGVYGLYDLISTVIYYGKTETSIKKGLQSHFSGAEGKCTQDATYFNSEEHFSPIHREKELMEQYKRFYGCLPKCNVIVL